MRPEATPAGTSTVRLPAATVDGKARVRLRVTALSAVWAANPVPVTVTVPPGVTTGGVTAVTVGADSSGPVTTKDCGLVAVVPPTVTVTRPVVAPAGTRATRRRPSARVTVAGTPWNATVFSAATSEKQPPCRVTSAPTAARAGTTDSRARAGAGLPSLATEVMLPVGSYR